MSVVIFFIIGKWSFSLHYVCR